MFTYLVIHRCEYYNGNKMLPVFSKSTTREHYSIETLTKLLLDTDSSVAKGKREVCSQSHNLEKCYTMDIRADENGVWDRKGSPVTYVSIHKNGSTTTVYKRSKLGPHAHHYKVTRVYYRHSSSPDFTRIITTVNGKGNCVAQSVYMYHVVSDCLECQLVTLVYLQITEVNCNA